MRDIRRIIVHCSATPANMDIGVAEIRAWHKGPPNNWSDIGYNYVIRRDGSVEKGRDLDRDGNVDEEIGAHAKGFNADSIGICMVGGTNATDRSKGEANFTIDQYTALVDVIRILRQRYGIAKKDIVGHRDLPGVAKSCPCFDVQGLLSLEK